MVAACLWSVGGYDSLTPVQYLCTVILDDDKKKIALEGRSGYKQSSSSLVSNTACPACPGPGPGLPVSFHCTETYIPMSLPVLYTRGGFLLRAEQCSAARCFCFCCCDLAWQSLSCYGMGQVVVCEKGVEWASDTVPADGQ